MSRRLTALGLAAALHACGAPAPPPAPPECTEREVFAVDSASSEAVACEADDGLVVAWVDATDRAVLGGPGRDIVELAPSPFRPLALACTGPEWLVHTATRQRHIARVIAVTDATTHVLREERSGVDHPLPAPDRSPVAAIPTTCGGLVVGQLGDGVRSLTVCADRRESGYAIRVIERSCTEAR